jgi:hypothetical protein
MGYFRKLLVGVIGALSLVGMGSVAVGAQNDTLISYDSMTPVTGAAVGAVNDRGIKGGGLAWVITSGSGEVDRQGNVEATVTGLVIPGHTPPNPIGSFIATVSCITPHGVVNVSTAPAPASTMGNWSISGMVDLPHPCKDPIVFVAAPTGQWFAMSNSDEGDD